MKILSLSLRNFRKFKDLEIEFPEGIIGLIGNNGAGKSTIIEAIGWAIYGNKASRTQKEGIKRQGASRHETCWVKLQMELGGNIYEIFRAMGNSSTDAMVKVNGIIAATSSKGVTQFMEKKLGMDYDAFYTSIVAKQQELNALSNKSPAERKRSMLKMLKIDVLEEAIKRVREDRRKKEEILEWIEKNLKDMGKLEEERKYLESRLKEFLNKKEKAHNEMKEMQEKLREIDEKRKIEKEKAEKYRNLNEKKRLYELKLRMNLKNKQNILKEKEEIEAKKGEYEKIKEKAKEYDMLLIKREEMEKIKEDFYLRKRLMEEIKVIEKELMEIEKIISSLEKEIEEDREIEKEAEQLNKILEEIEEKIREKEKEMERKIAIKKEMLERKREYENKLTKILQIGPQSNCPTCGRPLKEKYDEIVSSFRKLVEEYEEKANDIRKEIEEINRKIEEYKSQKNLRKRKKEEVDRKLEGLKIKEERLRNFYDRRKEKKNRIEEDRKRIEEIGEIKFNEVEYKEISLKIKELMPIKNRFIAIENEIGKLPKIMEQLNEIEKVIKSMEEEIESCNTQIKELAFDKERYNEIERIYEELKNKIYKKNEEIIKIEGEIEYIRRDIERKKEEIEEQKKQREKMKEMRKEIEILETLAGDRDTGLLNNFKRYLISKIGPLLSYYASHFFNMFTQGKYREIEIDENYDIYIYDRGEKFHLERFSGGEKDLANLSLRLAISQLITQRADASLHFIALDEIFGSQDRERRRNVLNALAELKEQFKQILLITHIEEIKDSLEHVIKVYEDENGISSAKVE